MKHGQTRSMKRVVLTGVGLLCLFSTLVLALIFAYYLRSMLLQKTDTRLYSAAEFLHELLGPGYHDRIVGSGVERPVDSVSDEEFRRILDRNDDICRRLGLQYLWSVLVLGDRIVFTSATRSDVNDPASAHASFFQTHEDPHAFDGAMGKPGAPVFSSFHNEWGEGRMVLVPRLDAGGRRYIVGASVQLAELNRLTQNAVVTAVAGAAVIFGFIWLMAGILIRRFSGALAGIGAAAGRMADGGLDEPLPVSRVEELWRLCQALDTMRVNLKDRIERLARSAEELKTERNRLAGIVEGTRSGTWEWNVQTGEIVINERWAEIIGQTLEEISGVEMPSPISIKTWMAYSHPDDLKNCNELLEKHFSGELDYYECESRMKHKNGEWIWVLDRGKAMSWTDDGRPLIVMGTHQDITERKRAEEALRESEEKFSTLFASMTDMVVLHELIFDDNGTPVNYRITDCNAAFTRITGIRHEDAVDKLADALYGTPAPPYLDEFSRVGITGEPCHYETYFAPMDKHFAISVVSPSKNRFATIAADISETKRIQAVIDAKNKELEQLVFVASHDLRSPLVNVDGFSRELDYSIKELTAMLEGGKDKEELEKALRREFPDMEQSINRIRASVSQMDKLLKGLLHLSRQGKAALQIEDIDMNGCLAQLALSFAFTLKEVGAEWTVDSLPDCRGDAVQVTQVFSNLIDNAIKYRDPARPLKIRIKGSIEMDRCVYRVEDNGIGIAENHLEHVFELFHRLEPDKTKGEGLGLTVVRQALSRMYGEIRVESQLGQGSVFRVTLPSPQKGVKKQQR